MVTASRPEAAAVADRLRAEISRMARDGTLDRILLPWAYFQTEEIRNFFLRDEAERRDRWIFEFVSLLALLGGVLWWQQRALHSAQLKNESAARESLAKTQVLRWMSHELRTPLNGIVAASSLLLRDPAAKRADSLELVRAIHSSGSVLTRLVGDVLDAAKIIGPGVGKMKFQIEATDLRQLFAEIAAEFRIRAEQTKSLTFLIAVSPNLPRYVAMDEVRLRQVLNNLLANAFAHTLRGFVRLRVELIPQGRLRVEVEDTGVGIALADQASLFEPFRRGDESRESSRGLGLGLSISREIITALGGEIGFDRERTKGSLFWFELDIKESQAPPSETPEAESEAARRLRVLVVKDDLVNRRLLTRLMTTLLCDVEVAENGLEAVDLCRPGRFDLILMDCSMPIMDGFEATREIRKRLNGTVYIAGCTANVLDADVERCYEAGMDVVIGKPVDVAKLRGLVDSSRASLDGRTPS